MRSSRRSRSQSSQFGSRSGRSSSHEINNSRSMFFHSKGSSQHNANRSRSRSHYHGYRSRSSSRPRHYNRSRSRSNNPSYRSSSRFHRHLYRSRSRSHTLPSYRSRSRSNHHPYRSRSRSNHHSSRSHSRSFSAFSNRSWSRSHQHTYRSRSRSIRSQSNHGRSPTISPVRLNRHDQSQSRSRSRSSGRRSQASVPMTDGKFQKTILRLLLQIRKIVTEEQRWQEVEPELLVEQLDALMDLDNLEESVVQDKEMKNKLTNKLLSVGGVDLKDDVRNILRRVMTNELMSKLNISGHRGKIPFKDYTIFKIIRDVATRAFNGTEKEVTECIARTLKYTPDRLGGGGRTK